MYSFIHPFYKAFLKTDFIKASIYSLVNFSTGIYLGIIWNTIFKFLKVSLSEFLIFKNSISYQNCQRFQMTTCIHHFPVLISLIILATSDKNWSFPLSWLGFHDMLFWFTSHLIDFWLISSMQDLSVLEQARAWPVGLYFSLSLYYLSRCCPQDCGSK